MSKKLGLALIYIGAYITLLGGLFYMMHFYGASWEGKTTPQDYEWIWGVLVAIVLLVGGVFAGKKYALGYVGFGIAALGVGLDIWLLVYGIVRFGFLSPFILTGAIVSALGVVLGVTFHVINTAKARKYGESLL